MSLAHKAGDEISVCVETECLSRCRHPDPFLCISFYISWEREEQKSGMPADLLTFDRVVCVKRPRVIWF